MESGSIQAVLNLITENNAALWMYDPMAGQAGAAGILINKDGAGVWGLSGNNNFLSSGGGTVMNVNEGSLLLSGGGARNSFRSDQANIHLAGSSSQFNLGAATLVVGGDNQILSDGQVNLNAGAVITVEGGRPASLTLNQAYLNGPVEFDIGTGERLALEAVLTGAGDLDKTGDGSLVLARTGHNFGDLTLTGGTLGLVASESEAALTVNSVTFNTGTTLDISGFSGEEFGQRVTLIVSNDDILFNEPGNQPKVTIGQNATVDFLTTQVELANNDKHLDAIIGLTWYDPSTDGTGSYDLAHGDFTLNDPSGGFKLEAQLNDRAGVFDSGWDGKSLTKKGQGILLLTADNTYSGRTTSEDGTLAIYSLDSSGLNQTDKEVEIQANGTL